MKKKSTPDPVTPVEAASGWVQVKSSHVHAVMYDRKSLTLTVRYTNGSVIAYPDWKEQRYQELLGAESVGGYLRLNIKPGRRLASMEATAPTKGKIQEPSLSTEPVATPCYVKLLELKNACAKYPLGKVWYLLWLACGRPIGVQRDPLPGGMHDTHQKCVALLLRAGLSPYSIAGMASTAEGIRAAIAAVSVAKI